MYAPEHALKGGYLYDEWDQELVRDLVDGMTPRSARLDLQTRAYDTLTDRIQQVTRRWTCLRPQAPAVYQVHTSTCELPHRASACINLARGVQCRGSGAGLLQSRNERSGPQHLRRLLRHVDALCVSCSCRT